jgi:hypothetical protein
VIHFLNLVFFKYIYFFSSSSYSTMAERVTTFSKGKQKEIEEDIEREASLTGC